MSSLYCRQICSTSQCPAVCRCTQHIHGILVPTISYGIHIGLAFISSSSDDVRDCIYGSSSRSSSSITCSKAVCAMCLCCRCDCTRSKYKITSMYECYGLMSVSGPSGDISNVAVKNSSSLIRPAALFLYPGGIKLTTVELLVKHHNCSATMLLSSVAVEPWSDSFNTYLNH